MPDTPTPLDLDAIRQMYAPRAGSMSNSLYRVVCALADEVERLRAELDQAAPHIAYDKGFSAGAQARPAPAWDEEAAERAFTAAANAVANDETWAKASDRTKDWWRMIVQAVVRDHLPVKPGREAVIDALWGTSKNLPIPHIDREEMVTAQADAVLSLLPGRSEAEVKAEALREASNTARRHWTGTTNLPDPADPSAAFSFDVWLGVLADHLAAEGGAS